MWIILQRNPSTKEMDVVSVHMHESIAMQRLKTTERSGIECQIFPARNVFISRAGLVTWD